jgi:hypothetical protein
MKSDSPSPAPSRDDSALRSPPAAFKWVLLLTPLLYLWFRLINNLRTEWETNPQYSYGYIVPFLCLGLILHRWQALREKAEKPKPETLKSDVSSGARETGAGKTEIANSDHAPRNTDHATRTTFNFQHFLFPVSSLRSPTSDLRPLISVFCFLLFAFLSFLYLPTRLIELATPEWRPIQWALGFIAIGLTLLAVFLGWGRSWLRALAFPLCFFLVAIPWPTLIEQPIIQSLTRINAALVIEVMGIIGVPALQHGNVIEVSTGVVGIDEACSGIRSFQSSIMI